MPGDDYLFLSLLSQRATNTESSHMQKKNCSYHTHTITFTPSAQLSTTLRSNCVHLLAYFSLRPTCFFSSLPPSHPFTFSHSQYPALFNQLICQFATDSHSYGTHLCMQAHTHTLVRERQVCECVDKWKLMRKKVVLFFCN